MKKLFMILLLTLPVRVLHAQTFAEWFRQGKTQKKYLVEQIAAFKVFAGYLEKGYAIAQSGLDAIHNTKEGDLNLHADYFNSLKAVNPQIKKDARVAGIRTLDAQIKKVAAAASQQAKKSTQIDASEKVYIEQVLDNLILGCKENVAHLLELITPDQVELTDDQRWRNIGELYADMEERYAFVKWYAGCVEQLIAARSAEEKDIKNQKSVWGIKQ